LVGFALEPCKWRKWPQADSSQRNGVRITGGRIIQESREIELRNRVAETILTASVGLIVVLAAAGAVLMATLAVAEIRHPLLQAISIAAELVAGAGLLVGSVFFATRFTVWVAGKSPDS
jgi:hypothetical protein